MRHSNVVWYMHDDAKKVCCCCTRQTIRAPSWQLSPSSCQASGCPEGPQSDHHVVFVFVVAVAVAVLLSILSRRRSYRSKEPVAVDGHARARAGGCFDCALAVVLAFPRPNAMDRSGHLVPDLCQWLGHDLGIVQRTVLVFVDLSDQGAGERCQPRLEQGEPCHVMNRKHFSVSCACLRPARLCS